MHWKEHLTLHIFIELSVNGKPDERQGAVLEFHNNSSKSTHGHRDVKQVEDKWLVLSKDIAGSHLLVDCQTHTNSKDQT